MVRTVIPTKTIETVEVGPFRANLRQWEHYPSQVPTFTVEVWRGWDLKICDEYFGHPQHRWFEIREELAVLVAKEAMGMGVLPTIKRETTPDVVLNAIVKEVFKKP